ncbi:5-hydroxytryptamine receptor 1-like [Dreissena polymorpha]|uniref:G-protein coupled receptors family 1 profile domain-containing protein n=1 Tax=Dreissena polymorpha TaxID=45954 RepID=A0A9D4ERW6_DREPO|nr:5-hydroxytryptamine receptor 1-like [Dreissena polymorpha]KAH3785739.1 hypothetical protein DPMN_163832 [Dreissena polymorpha]
MESSAGSIDLDIHSTNLSNSSEYITVNTTARTLANVSDVSNGTLNLPPPNPYDLWQQIIIAILLGILIIGTIVGNSLVCIAVAIVKRLQSPSNLLIVSLAVSDVLVAALVMPFGAVTEIHGYWIFNDGFCDFFTSADVILCTASILNLCMISIDRYFVITRPFQYALKRTPTRMAIMIAAVWLLSVLISIPPFFGWKSKRPAYACFISQEIGYQIYATVGAFYMPLIVMIVIYFRIWLVSSRIVQKEKKSKMGSIDRGNETINMSAKSSRSSGQSDHSNMTNGNVIRNGYGEHDDVTSEMLPPSKPVKRRFTLKSLVTRHTAKSNSPHSRERKATKTLGIIMGGFTLCWLPFFIVAVIRPFVGEHAIPIQLISCLTWLGYGNSFMNPLIYARFNREFRTPFREIICFRCRGINVRLRSESYVEQYGPDQIYHRDRDRDSLKPPRDSIVRYNSHGHTVVQIGNGRNGMRDTKI